MLKYTEKDLEKILSAVKSGADVSDIDLVISNPDGDEPSSLDIVDAVCNVMGCTVDDIQNPSRVTRIIKPRQMAAYFSYYYTREPLRTICVDLGTFTHPSVLHNVKSVENLLMYKDTRSAHDLVMAELRDRGFRLVWKDRVQGEGGYRFTKGQPSANPYGRPKGSGNKPKAWSEA